MVRGTGQLESGGTAHEGRNSSQSDSQSRFLNWQTFRTENLILLGHDEANKMGWTHS